jgi:hypothetical protein
VSNSTARVALVAAVTLVVLALPSITSGAVNIEGLNDARAGDFDSRTAVVAPTAAQLDAVNALGAKASWNQFGTPGFLFKQGGYLAAGVSAGDAATAARSWLAANAALFKLSSTDGLQLATAAPLPSSNEYAATFRQVVGGLVSADGVVTVGVQGSAADGWKIFSASSSLTGDDTLSGSTELSPTDALVQAAQQSGQDISSDSVTVDGTDNGTTTFTVDGLTGKQTVRRAAFATPQRGVIAAYKANLFKQKDDGTMLGYDTVVDAQTGDLLYRQSTVDQAVDDPTWLAFTSWPQLTDINAFPWNYPSADVRDLWCWTKYPSCQFEVANQASPGNWDTLLGNPATPSFTTTGNNVRDAENWNSANNPTTPLGFQPTSATRDYQYPFTNAWFETRCSQANFVPGVGNDIAASVTNLFAMHNLLHDWSYNLGFDEGHWNAQENNFGKPTLGNDSLFGDVQAGAVTGGFPTFAGRDNANMSTRPDGQHSVTNQYLWQPLPGSFYAPCVDGDFDASIPGHEFGHMIENRMIGKGNRRAGTHAGAMGEAFGDFDAVEWLNEYNAVPFAGVKSPFVEGAYATGNPIKGIRNYDMSWPMGGAFPQPGKDPYVNPLNLGDYGYDTPGPEVHSDGEIWIAVNYTLRDLFLQRYPSNSTKVNLECAQGLRPADACPGNRRWIQLVYDAMLLMPTAPTLLQARDAYLAADVARFGGANQDLLWLGFAARGFGQLATTTNNNDTDPVPDFSSPRHDNATLIFNAVAKDEGGHPVNASIYVGDYQARATPIADTNSATNGTNRDNVVPIVPINAYSHGPNYRAYNFVANAPGYGHVRFLVKDLKPGETRTVTIEFPSNYASTVQGATAAGPGTSPQNLLDDDEATLWNDAGAPVQGQQVVVKLGGTAPVTFSQVNVSAMIGPGVNRFVALRSFELYACTAGSDAANPACDGGTDAGWRRILKSQDDAFPGTNPRPIGADMIIRNWNVPTTTATHVRLVVDDNQCTGQESFHGDQDNDPLNNSDCRVGDPPVLPPRNTQVTAAELQVDSSKAVVIGGNAW